MNAGPKAATVDAPRPGPRNCVMLIDPQLDFAVKSGRYAGIASGALHVPGGEEAIIRAARFIDRLGGTIDDIHCTLDLHPFYHIANTVFWRLPDGSTPAPFTAVSVEEVESRRIVPFVAKLYDWGLSYVRQLRESGRYGLTLWPPHCLTGSTGSAVVFELMDSFNRWCERRRGAIHWMGKGQNWKTEHYSGMRAEVIDPDDPTTQLNLPVIRTLEQARCVYWMGIAGDFCVANTLKDTFDHFGTEALRNSVIVTDCVASIDPHRFEQIVDCLKAEGVRTATSVEIMA